MITAYQENCVEKLNLCCFYSLAEFVRFCHFISAQQFIYFSVADSRKIVICKFVVVFAYARSVMTRRHLVQGLV